MSNMKIYSRYLGLALALSVLVSYAVLLVKGDAFDEMAYSFIVLGGLTGLLLWIWMLTDFFKGGVKKHRILWGWALFIFTLLGAVVYFFLVYWRNNGDNKAG